MALPPHASRAERVWHYTYLGICTAIFVFLISPILVIIPLSFNAEPYFTFTQEMLSFDPDGYSMRWYEKILTFGMSEPDGPRGSSWWADVWSNAQWVRAAKNSVIIGILATILATLLGTVAALGLSRPEMPFRRVIMGLLISPMIVPVIITATGLFFFYSWTGLAHTYLGIIMAHATLGIPFVIITVTATLVGFDQSLTRAVVLFVASFDQQTIPRQMWNGIREQISPTILSVATVLVIFSIALLTTLELLRRRNERLRGLTG